MSRRTFVLATALLFALAGCGGSGGGGVGTGFDGEVSGIIFDEAGEPVRGARVFFDDGRGIVETVSNSSGAYVLQDVPSSDVVIRAELTQDGVRYVGQNAARVFEFERSRNVNIALYPESELAVLRGRVETAFGERISGARVFAISPDQLSSQMAITESDGEFLLRRLHSNTDYLVTANAPEFRADSINIRLATGEDRSVVFVLDENLGVPTISPPANIDAVAWTSPEESTRSRDAAAKYDAIKTIIDPRRAKRSAATRGAFAGNQIEVDLFWDPINSSSLLGFGIYRALGPDGVLEASDFLRDPLAEFFADADPALAEVTIYSYAMTSVNSDSEEGPMSGRVTVETLGGLDALSPTFNPLTFRWNTAPGADEYIVYVFEEEPRLGVAPLWSNEGSPTPFTQLQYTGPALVNGRTYYFVVLGVANANSSRTISRVHSFVASN